MKIIAIEIAETSQNFLVIGLGDDSNIYFWDFNEGKWIVYVRN